MSENASSSKEIYEKYEKKMFSVTSEGKKKATKIELEYEEILVEFRKEKEKIQKIVNDFDELWNPRISSYNKESKKIIKEAKKEIKSLEQQRESELRAFLNNKS